MRTTASVLIDRPIDQVFRLTTEQVALWSETVVEDEIVENHNNGGVGTKFRTLTEEKGRQMEFHGTVTRHEPPLASTVEMEGTMFDIEAAYTFEDLGPQTRVTQSSVVRGKGLFRIFLMLSGGLMRKSTFDAVQKELEGLKAFCEQHEPHVVR